MMLRAGVALALCLGSMAQAQSDDWIARVEVVKTGFDAAIAAEQAAQYIMQLEHPDMLYAQATLAGMTVPDFSNYTIADYANIAAQSKVAVYEMNTDAVGYGEIGQGAWAVLPYRIQLEISQAPDQPLRCSRLVVYGTKTETFATLLADTRSEAAFAAAFPDMAAMIAQLPHGCY